MVSSDCFPRSTQSPRNRQLDSGGNPPYSNSRRRSQYCPWMSPAFVHIVCVLVQQAITTFFFYLHTHTQYGHIVRGGDDMFTVQGSLNVTGYPDLDKLSLSLSLSGKTNITADNSISVGTWLQQCKLNTLEILMGLGHDKLQAIALSVGQGHLYKHLSNCVCRLYTHTTSYRPTQYGIYIHPMLGKLSNTSVTSML